MRQTEDLSNHLAISFCKGLPFSVFQGHFLRWTSELNSAGWGRISTWRVKESNYFFICKVNGRELVVGSLFTRYVLAGYWLHRYHSVQVNLPPHITHHFLRGRLSLRRAAHAKHVEHLPVRSSSCVQGAI